MIPKIMLEGGHAWVNERPIAARWLPGKRAKAESPLAAATLAAG
jgi:hypothetical protein